MRKEMKQIKQAFLDHIREDPTNNDIRLIFADWLEDHGEPKRAEFIRVQVEIDGLECNHTGFAGCRWCHLRARALTLGRGEQAEKATGVSLLALTQIPDLITRRGFVTRAGCDIDTWVQHRVELVRNNPIEEVQLFGKAPMESGDPYAHNSFANKFWWAINESWPSFEPRRLTYDLVGRDLDGPLYDTIFSIHNDLKEAQQWLSKRLIKRAIELDLEERKRGKCDQSDVAFNVASIQGQEAAL